MFGSSWCKYPAGAACLYLSVLSRPPGLLFPLRGVGTACVSCIEGSEAAHFKPKDITGLAFLVIAKMFVVGPFSPISLCGKKQVFLRQL